MADIICASCGRHYGMGHKPACQWFMSAGAIFHHKEGRFWTEYDPFRRLCEWQNACTPKVDCACEWEDDADKWYAAEVARTRKNAPA